MAKLSNTQKCAALHFKSIFLPEDARDDCVPVVVAVADKLASLSDVIDPTEAAEEELGLGVVDSTDEELESGQPATCGRSTPTLAINSVRTIEV